MGAGSISKWMSRIKIFIMNLENEFIKKFGDNLKKMSIYQITAGLI